MEFQIWELSEDHQKYNRNTHTPTELEQQNLIKKGTCHRNIFKHLKVDLSFVE